MAGTLMPSLMAKRPTACPLPTACAAASSCLRRRRPLPPPPPLLLPLLGPAKEARSSRPGSCDAAPTAAETAGGGRSFTSNRPGAWAGGCGAQAERCGRLKWKQMPRQ